MLQSPEYHKTALAATGSPVSALSLAIAAAQAEYVEAPMDTAEMVVNLCLASVPCRS